MAYTTTTELLNAYGTTGGAFGDIADIDGDGEPDGPAVTLAQSEADSLIDSYARRLYGDKLPFSTVPGLVKSLALAETIFVLKRNRGLLVQMDRDNRADRIKTLEDVEAGKLMLVEGDQYPIGDDDATTPRAVLRSESTSDPCGIITRSSLRGFT